MKAKKIYYFLLLTLMLSITGCDFNEVDSVITDTNATFYSVSRSLTIDSDDIVYNLAVQIPEAYTADKVVNVVASSSSTALNGEYNFTGNIVIPAGELIAYTPVSFNFNAIPSDVPRALVLNIEGTNEEITLDYTKICTSNDVNLNILFDNWPQETSWDIKDSSGAVVESGGTYPGQAGQTLSLDFTLADGTYTFTIYDAFSDGICCGFGNGAYSLTKPLCAEVLASGGEFGASESTTFSLP